MADKDQNSYLEIQFKQIFDKLGRVDVQLGKVFDRMDKQNGVLQRNTVVVEEHHKRSTTLENMMGQHEKAIHEIVVSLQKLNSRLDLHELGQENSEKENKKYKEKVDKLDGITVFFGGIPFLVKLAVGLLTTITLSFGVIKMIGMFIK